MILFNLSGHGLLDLAGYEEYLSGRMVDYEPKSIGFKPLSRPVARGLGSPL